MAHRHFLEFPQLLINRSGYQDLDRVHYIYKHNPNDFHHHSAHHHRECGCIHRDRGAKLVIGISPLVVAFILDIKVQNKPGQDHLDLPNGPEAAGACLTPISESR